MEKTKTSTKKKPKATRSGVASENKLWVKQNIRPRFENFKSFYVALCDLHKHWLDPEKSIRAQNIFYGTVAPKYEETTNLRTLIIHLNQKQNEQLEVQSPTT